MERWRRKRALDRRHNALGAIDADEFARAGRRGHLPVDPGTVERFLAKCSPPDDQGHEWWLGAIDGGADLSGGYGRFQAGSGDTLVTTTAHRYADTLEQGPIPPGIVVRHRCDEPLCKAHLHLVRGTPATTGGTRSLARTVRPTSTRAAVLAGAGPSARRYSLFWTEVSRTPRPSAPPPAPNALAGDPYRHQLTLFALPGAR